MNTDINFIEKYLSDTAEIAKTISVHDIGLVVEALFNAWRNDKTVYIIGNGGSGATSTHFACDLAKTTAVKGKKRFKALSLTDNTTLLISWINDDSYESVFVEQLRPFLAKGDVLIGISVHGASGKGAKHAWSQNIPAALELAKKREATTIALTGFGGGLMKEICDISVIVPFQKIPNVEDFHLVLGHLISNCLKEKIARYGGGDQHE